MKLRINTETIRALNPCLSRFRNWMEHYQSFDGDILKFLKLKNISPQDKVWVVVRILPRELIEVFGIDCAFSAADACPEAATYAADAAAAYAAAAYAAAYTADPAAASAAVFADAAADAAAYAAAYAAYVAAAAIAAADAAYAAAYAAAGYAEAAYIADANPAANAERERQIQALEYLIRSHK